MDNPEQEITKLRLLLQQTYELFIEPAQAPKGVSHLQWARRKRETRKEIEKVLHLTKQNEKDKNA